MGHLGNAIGFRLGSSRKWVAHSVQTLKLYRHYLQEDLLIFRFIKLFFRQYTMPIFTPSSNRTEKNKKINRISSTTQLIANQFIDFSFIFSNVSISRLHTLGVSCFFYDTLIEQWRQTFIKSSNNASLTFFNPKYQSRRKPSNFSDLKFLPEIYRETFKIRRKRKWKRFIGRTFRKRRWPSKNPEFLAIRKASAYKHRSKQRLIYSKVRLRFHRIVRWIHPRSRHRFTRSLARLRSRFTVRILAPIHRKSFDKSGKFVLKRKIIFKGGSLRKCLRLQQKAKIIPAHQAPHAQKKKNRPIINKLQFFPILLYDSKYYPNQRAIIKNRFKLLKVCLLLYQQKISLWKQQHFFVVLLKNLLLDILLCPGYVPPFIVFKLLNTLIIREFSFKHLNLFYFKEIFLERFLIFQGASSAIYSSLKSFDKNDRIQLSFLGMHVRNITASFITNYIIIKLGQYFSIHDIIRPFLPRLKNTAYILGFRIIVAGRLTRRERAAYIVRSSGDVTLGTKSCHIDYAADFKIMRFGVVGVKVWFHLAAIRPYYYMFNFSFNQLAKSK
jgi:hypothetical protein